MARDTRTKATPASTPTPAPTPTTKGRGYFPEFLSEILVSLGLDVAFREIAKEGFGHYKERLKGKLLNDKRSELLDDFRMMEVEGNEPTHLYERLEKAKENFTEDLFVELLCKLKVEEGSGRRNSLKWLNAMDDEKFDVMLALLNHDVVWQWIQRVWMKAGEITEHDFEGLRSAIGKTLGGAVKGAAKATDSPAGFFAGVLGGFMEGE